MTHDEVRNRSGLSREELAKIYGVTRQTMHYWRVRGVPKYDTHAGRMADVITKALTEALQRKLLPLPAMSKAARRDRVATMARKCQELRPPT